jgi:glycosyltransferase involved in cell wall biosynthesis
MASGAPRVSILMAVFNSRRTLAACLRSMVCQTFSDFEFIIVDDGSTDGGGRVLQRWARKDPRFQVLSRPNRGLTVSLNEAMASARGEYLARMDADDISLPLRLEWQVKHLDQHPECVAVGGEVLLVDPGGWPIGLRGHAPDHETIDRELLRGNGGAMTHPAILMRADVVRAAGGYREIFDVGQDLDLFLRLSEAGRLANLPEVVLRWRQSVGSVTQTKANRWVDIKRRALADAARRRGLDLDVDAIVAASPAPTATPRLEWGNYALRSGHPWTAMKCAAGSLFREKEGIQARRLLREAWSSFYWHGFRSKLSKNLKCRP